MKQAARVTAEQAARASYGRLLALLASRTHDIAAAEDALAEAFVSALRLWPERGVPERPEAWLLVSARNRLTDVQRRAARWSHSADIPEAPAAEGETWPDRRLVLMLACTHPAIARDLHTPLILQVVLGVEASRIARLFLMPEAALAQRLVRAKRKIREAGIPFDLPSPEVLPQRVAALCEAIYGAHALDWLAPGDDLGEEALYLADLLVRLLPEEAEVLGLAALIAFGHARAAARLHHAMLVPVGQQDMTLWDDVLTGYGLRCLARAAGLARPGRFQTEAAIQSVHLARKQTGVTDWAALRELYAALLRFAPSAGALVAQAVVTAELNGPAAGLAALDRAETQLPPGFQPFWAARAEFLARAGNPGARSAYDRAISLTTEMPLRRWLMAKRDALPPC